LNFYRVEITLKDGYEKQLDENGKVTAIYNDLYYIDTTEPIYFY
jgi:hypothetical protein